MTECRDEKQEGGVSIGKQAYYTPQLTCYGLIQTVTQSAAMGSVADITLQLMRA